LTKCGDLSEAEVEETETAVVAVRTAETAEVLETVAVMITIAALTIKAAATLKMAAMVAMTATAAAVTALIEAAVTERAAVVYWRGHWFVSIVSDVRIMWNITV
jgi:hypothetical protein